MYTPMGGWTLYCVVSGCTPDIANNLCDAREIYGPIVTAALASLQDQHKFSQNDVCVIGPVGPSGEPLWEDETTLIGTLADRDLNPETDIRVVPHCVMGRRWGVGYVDGPERNGQVPKYLVSEGYGLMVQTHALDIVALATRGRMTPLRLWNLGMAHGFDSGDLEHRFEGVDYGGIEDQWEQSPDMFPGYAEEELCDFEEELGDAEVVEQYLVHWGRHWLWMPPDRFPVSPTVPDYSAPARRWGLGERRSGLEGLPSDVLIHIVSSLPFSSVLNLADTSQSLRTAILGNDYLVCSWLYQSAPWWIPVPIQTPKKGANGSTSPSTTSQVFLASGWSEDFQLSLRFPTGLDWAYVMRCARSGSMRNRERIWNTVLDIERVADLAGV